MRSPISPAHAVLDEAASIINGDRDDTHGAPERSFPVIAKLWSAYLGRPVTALDVCQMMTLLKIGRARAGTPIRDHFVDAAGYQALAAEVMGSDADPV